MDKHNVGPKIRDGITDGRLPTRTPSRTWFGFAQGDTSCTACGDSIATRELECEAEFPEESRTWLFHGACFEIWEVERIALLTGARNELPMAGPPAITANGDQAHAAHVADSSCGVADSSRADGASRVRRSPWPARILRDLSGGVRRSAREFIGFIAPRRRARPR